MSLSNSKKKLNLSESKSAQQDRYFRSQTQTASVCRRLDFQDQSYEENQQTTQILNKDQHRSYNRLLRISLRKRITRPQQQYQSKINRTGFLMNWYWQIQPKIKQSVVRQIPKSPYKILNAPLLKDDFYTNLLDWSKQDIISVVLDNAIYLWPSKSSEAQKLLEGYVSCVKWGRGGLIIGEQNGRIRIIDTQKRKQKSYLREHTGRVGVIDVPNSDSHLMATGSKYSELLIWDVREGYRSSYGLQGHKQQICGLKWSPDGNYLASGGNDNMVCVWDLRMIGRQIGKSHHQAAVKALAWSPHQSSLLVSGGGSTDKTIKIWNTHTMKCCQSVNTGSQVCNLQFSTSTNQLVSTHGYSMNSIVVWDVQSMQKVSTLLGHSYRVLYMARSPDQQSILTGSGDQTLRFWKLFPSRQQSPKNMNLSGHNLQLR